MAQYFVSSSSRLTQQHDMEPNAVYIFPNPSSAPPSPSQTSSSSKSSRDSTYSSTLSSDTVNDLEQWEWLEGSAADETADHFLLDVASEDQSEECILNGATIRATGRGTQSRRTLRSHPLQDYLTRSSLRYIHRVSTNTSPTQSFHTLSTASSSVTSTRTPVHPKLPPPFLSLFLSFLSVDESTVHLLSRTSQHSVLFPGDTVRSDPCLAISDSQGLGDRDTNRDTLLEFDEELSVYTRLREGHAVVCNYQDDLISPLFGFSFKLSSLWGFVYDFVQQGVKGTGRIAEIVLLG